MREKEYLVILILGAVILLICQNTMIEWFGCLCVSLMIIITTFFRVCMYHVKSCKFSDKVFKLQSNDYKWELLTCLILGKSFYKNDLKVIMTNGIITAHTVLAITLICDF